MAISLEKLVNSAKNNPNAVPAMLEDLSMRTMYCASASYSDSPHSYGHQIDFEEVGSRDGYYHVAMLHYFPYKAVKMIAHAQHGMMEIEHVKWSSGWKRGIYVGLGAVWRKAFKNILDMPWHGCGKADY